GGGVRDARRLLGDEAFLLLNGDAFLSIDLGELLRAHFARGDAATMAVAPMPPNETFGGVETGDELEVRRFSSHADADPAHARWHFLGVHVISPAVFDFIPPTGEQDINRGVYLAMVRAGLKVRVWPMRIGAWADMGSPRRYLQAAQDLLSGLCDLTALGPHAPLSPEQLASHRGVPPSQRRLVLPGALVDGSAVLEESIVSPGVSVGANAVVRRSVVLARTAVAEGEELVDTLASGALRLS
ncbi:MAG: sugar phosphate nucleotidyltransferase, partial [Myxococcales bacterium]